MFSFLVMFDIDVWRVWEEPTPKSFWLMFFVSASDIKMVARNTVVFRPLKATWKTYIGMYIIYECNYEYKYEYEYEHTYIYIYTYLRWYIHLVKQLPTNWDELCYRMPLGSPNPLQELRSNHSPNHSSPGNSGSLDQWIPGRIKGNCKNQFLFPTFSIQRM